MDPLIAEFIGSLNIRERSILTLAPLFDEKEIADVKYDTPPPPYYIETWSKKLEEITIIVFGYDEAQKHLSLIRAAIMKSFEIKQNEQVTQPPPQEQKDEKKEEEEKDEKKEGEEAEPPINHFQNMIIREQEEQNECNDRTQFEDLEIKKPEVSHEHVTDENETMTQQEMIDNRKRIWNEIINQQGDMEVEQMS